MCAYTMLLNIILISTEMCRNDNDNDDEYCNYNALLRLLITNNMIPHLHGFNFKALIIIVIIVIL